MHLGSPMEQLEGRSGCHEAPLSFGSDWPVMKRAALAMALAAGFLVSGAVAQPPSDDKKSRFRRGRSSSPLSKTTLLKKLC